MTNDETCGLYIDSMKGWETKLFSGKLLKLLGLFSLFIYWLEEEQTTALLVLWVPHGQSEYVYVRYMYCSIYFF